MPLPLALRQDIGVADQVHVVPALHTHHTDQATLGFVAAERHPVGKLRR